MARTCSGCGYGPIGAFTDNCPMCGEPVRSVRGGAEGSFGGSRTVLKWVIGGIVVAMLGMGACCGVGMWWFGTEMDDLQDELKRQQAFIEAQRQARIVVVPAAQLIQEFEANAEVAEERYKGKYLEIAGVVERSGGDETGAPFVVLHSGNENAKFKIECHFDFVDETGEVPILRLEKGRTITVRGDFGGRISHIQVRQCVLVK